MTMIGTTGEIITFYSYKGGTGRSMALSNVACLLAERQSGARGILMIDWDLEAPGLDKYFHNRFKIPLQLFKEKNGLIDLFLKINALTPKSIPANEEEAEKIAYNAIDKIDLDDFIVQTDIDNLSLLKAGRFDANYSTKVNSFDWENLHNRSPLLIRLFAERLSEKYRYILIDSRTGYTDTSGICTMLMPEKLVVVFTPNRQSYTGIEELIVMAMKYRKKSDDLRPLLVYPLPSRIEFSMDELRQNWRFGKTDQDIEGFQPMFEKLFKEVYELGECNLEDYFNEVQIQQNPYYAYGEEIAVIAKKIEDRFKDRFTLTESFRIFTEWLVNSTAPWRRIKEKIGEIFCSYAQADRAIAQSIGEALEHKGFSVWWDNIIPVGSSFDDIIEDKINNAKCVIVLWSKNSIKSKWVKYEASEGARRQILIPILIDDVKPPLGFGGIQTANLINWQENVPNEEFDRLIESIKNLVSGIKYELEDKQSISNTLDQLGNIQYQQGNYEEALKLYQQSLKIKNEMGDKSGNASTLHRLGMIQYELGNYQEAEKLYQHSMEIKNELGDKNGIALTLHQLGIIHQQQGNYQEATKFYQQSLEITKKLGDKRGIAYTLGQLGNIQYSQGKYDEAVKLYQETLMISEELGDKSSISTALHQLGLVHHYLGNYQEAGKLCHRSLEIAKELGDKSGIAISLHQLGTIHSEQGNYEEATKFYQQSLKMKEELGDKRGIAITLHALGMLHEKKDKNFPAALEKYLIALTLYEELRHPYGEQVKNLIATLKEKMGEEAFNKTYEEFRRKHDT